MEENKVKSWRGGVKIAMAALLICLAIFYYSYIYALVISLSMKEFSVNLIQPIIVILCYLVFGIVSFIFIAKGKCPGLFFKLSLLVAPIGLFISDIRAINQLSTSTLNIAYYCVEFLVIALIVLFVIFAIFNVAGKKKLWSIIGISISIGFNLFILIGYVDLGLGFKEYLNTYLYQSMKLIHINHLYLHLFLNPF